MQPHILRRLAHRHASIQRGARLSVLLAGRAAELLVFGKPSTGAADDLSKATALARALVTRYGMSAGLGLVAYEEERTAFLPGVGADVARHDYSDDTARQIDQAIREVIRLAFVRATTTLTHARPVLESGARQLLNRETLGEAELAALKVELQAALAAAPAGST